MATYSNLPALLLLALLTPCSVGAQTLADQPKEQREAVRKILDLGGDWEAGRKTVLIGFIGDKFTNEKYVLLEPLTDLRIFAVSDSPANDCALAHCGKLENIEFLEFTDCKFTGSGLRHLSKCKKLRKVWITDTPISDEGLANIAKFDSLESLVISQDAVPTKITAAGVRQLKVLKKLKTLALDVADLPDGLQEEMDRELPVCEVHLHGSKVAP